MEKTKNCSICQEEKNKNEFRRKQIICKDCESDSTISYSKTCSSCNETKLNSCFRKKRKQCLDCERAFGRNYRRTTTKAKEWYENNKEKMAELQSNWYEKNKSYIRQNERERMKNDPIFKEIKNYRKSVQQFVRSKCLTNSKIGTDKTNFINWLKFSFVNEMNLENYGSYWQIDHALPLDLITDTCALSEAKFIKSKENYKILIYSWFNIAPIEKSANRTKSNSINKDYLINHLNKLNSYCEENEDLETDENMFKYKNLIQSIIDL